MEAQGGSVEDFRGRDFDRYQVERTNAGLSPVTRRYDAMLIKMLLRYAYQEELLARDPLGRIIVNTRTEPAKKAARRKLI